MNGIFRVGKGPGKAAFLLAFAAIVAFGGPAAAGVDGDVSPDGGTVRPIPCGSPVDGPDVRSGNAGQAAFADPGDGGVESPRGNGEAPLPGEAPCSIDTLRKRAARARIS